MVRRLLLVDSKSTLERLRHAGLIPGASIVALNKYGMAACDQAGLPYTIPDDYHSVEDLVALSLGTYERLEKFCAARDTRLESHLALFRWSFYNLKILADVVGTKAFQVRKVLDATGAEEVVYQGDALPPALEDDLGFPEAANLFAALLPLAAAGKKLTALPGPALYSELAQARRWTARRIFAALRRRLPRRAPSSPRTYLAAYEDHDVPFVMAALEEAGLSPVRFGRAAQAGDSASFERLWQELNADPGFRGFFSAVGIDYFPLIEPRLRRLVTQVFPRAAAAYAAAKIELGRLSPKPSFALTSVVTLGAVERARLKAAQDLGIPLVSYQEGAGFGSVEHPMNDYAEVTDGDHFLCYGAGNAAYREALVAAGRKAKLFHAVGSAHLDALKAKIHGLKPHGVRRVVYVANMAAVNRQHHPYNAYTDTAYFRSQKAIFNALEAAPQGVSVAVKPHPADPLLRGVIARRPRIKVIGGVLDDHLNDADLFIVDFPSTTLLSCCLTQAHIFVLCEPGVAALPSRARTALEKRAYVFQDVHALASELGQVLSGAKPLEPRTDDAYVRDYGVHFGDGRSARRAAQVLASL